MNSNKKTGRLVGVLFLLVFIIGVLIYQVLRGPFLFADDFLVSASLNENQIIISVLLAFLSGIATIGIAVLLFPIFTRSNPRLAFLYIAFCILSFVAIVIENYSALSLLELSHEYVNTGTDNKTLLETMGNVFYNNHKWSHLAYLLISCFPVFVLYFTLLYSKLVPKAISIFGIIAVLLMFIQVLFSIFKISLSMNLLLPIALIQIFLPFWLIFKGLNSPLENNSAIVN
jgi:hypothetical protein